MEQRIRREAEEKLRRELEEKSRAEAEQRTREAEELRRKLEEERKAREEEERAAREAAERLKKEIEERIRRETEEKVRREMEEKARLEAELHAREAEELRLKIEVERKAREDAERAARAAAERARKEAEEKARQEAEQKERREAEEKDRQEAQARAFRENEEKARKEEEEKARRLVEEKERKEEEEKARRLVEEKARKEEEEKARHLAEEKERKEAEEKARHEAAEKARKEADEKAHRHADERARHEASEKARHEASEKARKEADEKSRKQFDERARHEASERARKEADEQARKEAAARAAASVSERHVEHEDAAAMARAKAESAALARKDERARERAKAEKRKSEAPTQSVVQDEPRQAYRRKRSMARPIAIGLFALLICAVIALHLIPLDARSFEQAAEASLGQQVKIGVIHISLFPSPQLKMEGVTIGTDLKAQIATVKALPQLGSIWESKKIFNQLELDGLKLPQEWLGAVLWGSRDAEAMRVGRLIVRDWKPDIEGLTLPPMNIDAGYSKDGALEKVVALNSEKTMTLKLGFAEGRTQIEFSGKPFKLPFGGEIEFQDFSGTGTLSPTELIFSQFEATTAGGNLAGNARLRWGANWTLDGEVNARGLDAGRVASLLISSGRLDGKAGYSMRAPGPGKLEGALRVEGTFTVQKGTLGGVDLTHVLQGETTPGGNTMFSEMTGNLLYDAGRVQARQVRLAAGLLNATGNVSMDAQKNLSGGMQMELKAVGTQMRASLSVGGTLSDPSFKR